MSCSGVAVGLGVRMPLRADFRPDEAAAAVVDDAPGPNDAAVYVLSIVAADAASAAAFA